MGNFWRRLFENLPLNDTEFLSRGQDVYSPIEDRPVHYITDDEVRPGPELREEILRNMPRNNSYWLACSKLHSALRSFNPGSSLDDYIPPISEPTNFRAINEFEYANPGDLSEVFGEVFSSDFDFFRKKESAVHIIGNLSETFTRRERMNLLISIHLREGDKRWWGKSATQKRVEYELSHL